MEFFNLTSVQIFFQSSSPDSRFELANMPIGQFKWWIILCVLALHTIIAVIITELMTRTYGRWYIWLPLALALPVIGPIGIYFWHLGIASSLIKARKKTFWKRVLFDVPVSLYRILLREQARTQEVVLNDVRPVNKRVSPVTKDPELEKLLASESFAEARALAWRMLEIATDMHDTPNINLYQEYLSVIGDRESMASGIEL